MCATAPKNDFSKHLPTQKPAIQPKTDGIPHKHTFLQHKKTKKMFVHTQKVSS
jgi:hypothetical protein